MSSTERDRIKGILNLADKHSERARDNEDIAWARASDTRAKHLDAIRHNARLGGLAYAVSKIRKIADEWDETEGTPEQALLRKEHVAALDDLAFRLLSEVDES